MTKTRWLIDQAITAGRPTREKAIFDIMSDGQLHTLSDLSTRSGFPEPSVAAQLRAFRWPSNGGFTILKEVVRVHDKHRIYGYRFGEKLPPEMVKPTSKDLLKRCHNWLKTFHSLDPEGQTLLKLISAKLTP
jgi:hypothetical protein